MAAAATALASAPAPVPLPAAFAGWWEHMNGSPAWQDGTFRALAALYGLIVASSFADLEVGCVEQEQWHPDFRTNLVAVFILVKKTPPPLPVSSP
ncbi:tobamovirus multiplication protein 3-like [Hordeum vulgare]|nr:tobamovirus multiplication protein 3-like [Hordeum vulgare]